MCKFIQVEIWFQKGSIVNPSEEHGSLWKRNDLCLLIVVSTSSERSKRQSEDTGFGKEDEEAAEAEVPERWPEKKPLKNPNVIKGVMAHRVYSGKEEFKRKGIYICRLRSKQKNIYI